MRCLRTLRFFSSFPAAGLILLLSSFVIGHSSFAGAFISESPDELFTTADFDGDGRPDILIVDKPTGAYRIGYQLAAGTYTWVQARASGVQNVTGLAAGRLFDLARDGLAFTSAEANRVNLFDAADPNTAGLPRPLYISSLGPSLVTALDIGGLAPPPSDHDDLFIASIYNHNPDTLVTTLRNNGALQTPLFNGGLPPQPARANRVVLKSAGPVVMLGLLFRENGADRFRGWDLSDGGVINPVAPDIEAAALAPGGDYVFAQFSAGSTLSQFLFWQPGDKRLHLLPIEDPAPDPLRFGMRTTFTLAKAIEQVFTLPGAADTKLLVLYRNGDSASVFNFDGAAAPTLVQNFVAPEGERFSGAAGIGSSGLMLFAATGGGRSSTTFKKYSFNGASYDLAASGNLPPLSPFSAAANVFQFQLEPFVYETPVLLRSLNARDWSSQFMVGGGAGPPVSVMAETFVNSAQGLDNPASVALGDAASLPSRSLVNQYQSFISLSSIGPAIGDEASEVSISPAPGHYKTAIKITLTPSVAGHQAWFRLSSRDAWQLYSGPAIVFTNSTVYYYAKNPAEPTAKSRIRTATYTFAEGPGTLDSDGDGVPDYVELGHGLDPIESGSDADGDGYSDLDEILAGGPADPARADRVPDDLRREKQAVFDLKLTPRPWDGFSNLVSLCASGAMVRAFDLAGSLLSYSHVTNVSGLPHPSAKLTNVLYDTRQRLVVSATELHYDLFPTTNVDKTVGRELLRLVPVPPIPAQAPVPYVYGDHGGDIEAESDAWVNAARNPVLELPRPTVRADLEIYDSLSALLFERKVAEILRDRGEAWWANLTLFPFRPSDAGRQNPSQSLLLSLEQLTPSGQPGYLLVPMFNSITGLVHTAPLASIQALKQLTADLYRISSACNNTSPGTFASPVDALREFIHTGELDANYLTKTNVAPAVLTDAATGVRAILDMLHARPTTNLALRVRADSFNGACTVLETLELLPRPKNLVNAAGAPFEFPNAFQFPTGSIVHIFGFTDIASAGCLGEAIEVITNLVEAMPAPSDLDTDGDLLVDSWERLFINLGDAFSDADGDGYSNLQEMFERSDPRDGLARPAVPAAPLAPPLVSLEPTPFNGIILSWSWPAVYADRVAFSVRTSETVDAVFATDISAVPLRIGDQYQVTLADQTDATHFYFVSMRLR